MSVLLKKETFLPLLHTKFQITFDTENQYEAELIEVKAYNPKPSLNLETFSLLFRADPNLSIFAQRIYQVYSEATGPLDLFLVPRSPDNDGIYYEVVIN